MGYIHLDNLYKNVDILQFKKVYALEKIHGTSAHIKWQKITEGELVEQTHFHLTFFAGGEKHEKFVGIFNQEELRKSFNDSGVDNFTIYGEAYGGKQQGMRDTYGDQLRFVAFDVQIDDKWLSVPQAHSFCTSMGIDFVHYEECPAELVNLNYFRDLDSYQAIKNGIGPGKMREGIVIRPPFEVTTNNGKRVMAKHKRDEFKETATPRVVDPARLVVLDSAKAIASEWVTEMRLGHVLDKLSPPALEMSDVRRVISAMQEDVKREGEGEIVWSNEVAANIGKATAALFKQRITVQLVKNY